MSQSSTTPTAPQSPSSPSAPLRKPPRVAIIATTTVVVIAILILSLFLLGTIPGFSPGGPPSTYTVTFEESNLQRGGVWNVTLDGSTNSSTSRFITFSEPNGAYNYSVASPTFTYDTINPSVGTAKVDGAAIIVPIAFIIPLGTQFAFGSPSNISGSGSCEYCYDVPIASATSVVTTANVTFAVLDGGGKSVALTGSMVLVNNSGASLATYSFITDSWAPGSTVAFTSGDTLTLNSGTTPLFGYTLEAVGTNALKGAVVSPALP